MEKKKFHSQAIIPLVTAIFAVVFIVLGIVKYGFWETQPMPGFFPVIIAVVLLIASIVCMIQLLKNKEAEAPSYNKDELMIILGAASIIIATYLIGLVASCLLFLFLWLKFMEHASWKTIIIIEIILAAIILGVFVFWLQVQFPMGLFEYIL